VLHKQTERFVQAIEKTLMENPKRVLWCLINNAGRGVPVPVEFSSLSDFQKTMDVNYIGLVRTTKSVLPLLKQTPGSRIINITSAVRSR
jgi:NAD(P)-dependent dehydrogenase (short-subunit alcohol dehydrogenase family)